MQNDRVVVNAVVALDVTGQPAPHHQAANNRRIALPQNKKSAPPIADDAPSFMLWLTWVASFSVEFLNAASNLLFTDLIIQPVCNLFGIKSFAVKLLDKLDIRFI